MNPLSTRHSLHTQCLPSPDRYIPSGGAYIRRSVRRCRIDRRIVYQRVFYYLIFDWSLFYYNGGFLLLDYLELGFLILGFQVLDFRILVRANHSFGPRPCKSAHR